jgi:hypothetical protein
LYNRVSPLSTLAIHLPPKALAAATDATVK